MFASYFMNQVYLSIEFRILKTLNSYFKDLRLKKELLFLCELFLFLNALITICP